MKKKEILARYAELSDTRNEVAAASARALSKIAGSEVGGLTTSELASVHSDIVFMASFDEENDQREIANLIAVATSDAFGHLHREEAARRVAIMLELDT